MIRCFIYVMVHRDQYEWFVALLQRIFLSQLNSRAVGNHESNVSLIILDHDPFHRDCKGTENPRMIVSCSYPQVRTLERTKTIHLGWQMTKSFLYGNMFFPWLLQHPHWDTQVRHDVGIGWQHWIFSDLSMPCQYAKHGFQISGFPRYCLGNS